MSKNRTTKGESGAHLIAKQLICNFLKEGGTITYNCSKCNEVRILPKAFKYDEEVSHYKVKWDVAGLNDKNHVMCGIEILYSSKASKIEERNVIPWIEIYADDVCKQGYKPKTDVWTFNNLQPCYYCVNNISGVDKLSSDMNNLILEKSNIDEPIIKDDKITQNNNLSEIDKMSYKDFSLYLKIYYPSSKNNNSSNSNNSSISDNIDLQNNITFPNKNINPINDKIKITEHFYNKDMKKDDNYFYDKYSNKWIKDDDINNIEYNSNGVSTKLLDGRIFIVDKQKTSIYNPFDKTFTKINNTINNRKNAILVTLKDGRVMAIGGNNQKGAEFYDLFKGKWEKCNNHLKEICRGSGVVMNDGKVFISYESIFQIYDPKDDKFTILTSDIPKNVSGYDIILLPNGNIFMYNHKTYLEYNPILNKIIYINEKLYRFYIIGMYIIDNHILMMGHEYKTEGFRIETTCSFYNFIERKWNDDMELISKSTYIPSII